MNVKKLITILGPTASGKTTLAAQLASHIDGEVISADSRQVYRQMDLGTGKDLADYVVDGKQIEYHLIDIVDAGYKYNLFEYQRDFLVAYDKVVQKGKQPILCGGTGLYIEAVLNGYNLVEVPENADLRTSLQSKSLDELKEILQTYKTLHNDTDVDTAKRAIRAIEIEEYYRHNNIEKRSFPKIEHVVFGIDIDRDLRRQRISKRLEQRLDEGMIEEVRSIMNSGVSAEDLIYYGLEYKYVTMYMTGQLSYEEMYNSLEVAIHQFAKRQMTWFRGMERRGFTINWLDYNLANSEKIEKIISVLSK